MLHKCNHSILRQTNTQIKYSMADQIIVFSILLHSTVLRVLLENISLHSTPKSLKESEMRVAKTVPVLSELLTGKKQTNITASQLPL